MSSTRDYVGYFTSISELISDNNPMESKGTKRSARNEKLKGRRGRRGRRGGRSSRKGGGRSKYKSTRVNLIWKNTNPRRTKRKKNPPPPSPSSTHPKKKKAANCSFRRRGGGSSGYLKTNQFQIMKKKITSDLGERRISEFQKRGKMAAKESDKMARSSHHRNKPEIEKFTRNQCHSNFPVFTNGNIFLVCLEKRVRRSDMIVMVMREPPHLHILGIAGEV